MQISGKLVASMLSAIGAAAAIFTPDLTQQRADAAFVLDHEAVRIDGTAEDLADAYGGKVVLIVNVASKCGFTPQYKGLQSLYERYEARGLVVLGFPANNFGGQEPGSDEEILEYCTSRFEVSFPMFSKIDVVGEDRHALYEDLAKQPEPIGGDPRWNFTKYLVGRDGRVRMRFESRESPTGGKMVRAVERLLAETAPAGLETRGGAEGSDSAETTEG